MKTIDAKQVEQKITQAFLQINYLLPKDAASALRSAVKQEKKSLAKATLQKICLNATLAGQEMLPICQDTGTAIVFLEVGQNIIIKGDINNAIQSGVKKAYQGLRKSIVGDPLVRQNTKTNCPAVIHTELVPGNKLTIHCLAKGGGAENKSMLKMFRPTATAEEIVQFVIETVKNADAAACPPLVIGLGLGGTFDSVAILAKKALLRKMGTKNKNKDYQELEETILKAVNSLNIGPAGYGGKTTALAVQINAAPCHIASLPVAVNIQCHASRHITFTL